MTREAVAELLTVSSDDAGDFRPLTPEEQALLEQSKRDFAEGRTLTFDELVAHVDARLAPLGIPPYRR